MFISKLPENAIDRARRDTTGSNTPDRMPVGTAHGLMKGILCTLVLAALTNDHCAASDLGRVHYLTFPRPDVDAVGQIHQLNVVIDCSWIASLTNIPELYDIEMAYDMPTQNLLEARPRLGAAAVKLAQWNGVIGVRIPLDADARSCFDVTVSVGDEKGVVHEWKGKQLGLPD